MEYRLVLGEKTGKTGNRRQQLSGWFLGFITMVLKKMKDLDFGI
jgi:beta-lactamase class D